LNWIFRNEKLTTFLFFGTVLLLYVVFPSHNNSGDAWGMAADVRYGHDLFSPHHLLYSVTVYIFKVLTGTTHVLRLAIFCNAIFAFLSVFVLYKILGLLMENRLKVLYLTATAAFSFGFWRFATENEAYIMPIFFSLLGSYYFIKTWRDKRYTPGRILLSGLFATIACLYHQIHIFWFIGLLFGWLFSPEAGEEWAITKGIKRGFLFGITFFMAPLTYFAVITSYLHQSLNVGNILHFVFHDYYSGSAGNHVGFDNFFLGSINFIRTFYQVHGQMQIMVSKNLVWLLPGIAALGVILFGVVQIFRKQTVIDGIKKLVRLNLVTHVHLLIFILQFAFAVYNIGNAEFMVMLPVLLAIVLAGSPFVPANAIGYFALSLLICNAAYGIYPNNKLHFNADDKITEFIIDHPNDKFIVAEPAIVLNRYYYIKGHWPDNCWAGPSYYELHAPLSELETRIDSTLEKHGNIYTDCKGRPVVASRGSMLYNSGLFFEYSQFEAISRFKTDAGDHTIYKIVHWKKFHPPESMPVN
jgi:hypothetical protein